MARLKGIIMILTGLTLLYLFPWLAVFATAAFLYGNYRTTRPRIPYAAYKEYLKSPEWARLRIEVFKRDRYTCQHCGDPIDATTGHCHHITYRRLRHERIGDLLTLCRHCHRREHRSWK